MTKRALIVICVLMLLPVAVVVKNYREWKGENETVASYGQSTDEIIYGSSLLKKVEGSEEYLFRKGSYLGKIGDRYFGSQLYTLMDDSDGDYYVMAGNDGLVLLSETGRMTDGIKGANSTVTRIIAGDYVMYTDDEEKIELFLSSDSYEKTVKFVPDDYSDGEYASFRIMYCYDASPVATGNAGFVVKLNEKNRWLWISAKAEEDASYDLEQGSTDTLTYRALQVGSPALMKMLDTIISGEETASEAPATDTADTN